MKTYVWMICCLGWLAPLQLAGADEASQGYKGSRLGIRRHALEQIPIAGPLLKLFAAGEDQPCAEPLPVAPAEILAPAECEAVDMDCPQQQARQCRIVGVDGLELIGIDFDLNPAENCAQCQTTRCAPANSTRAVATCAPQAPHCTAPAAAYGPQYGPYAPSQYSAPAYQVLPAPMAMLQAQSFAGRDELIEALMEARVSAAIAETALEVREETDTKQFELIKELLSSQVENAKLAAKLELAAEKEKMLAELYEARVELTALQFHVARENELVHRKRQRKDSEARRPADAVDAVR